MEQLRFERKYFIEELTYHEALAVIKLNPAMFREIYHERSINNIYFDSLDYTNLFDNINGVQHRTKYRIRWYGELFGKAIKPVLELKIKNGLTGRKEHYPLPEFIVDKNFSWRALKEHFKLCDLPPKIKYSLLALEPVLLNRYVRKYFISEDKTFRLTLDSKLAVYQIGKLNNNFLHKRIDDDRIIIEIKYDKENDPRVMNLAKRFPFRLSKSSKYANGIETLYDF